MSLPGEPAVKLLRIGRRALLSTSGSKLLWMRPCQSITSILTQEEDFEKRREALTPEKPWP